MAGKAAHTPILVQGPGQSLSRGGSYSDTSDTIEVPTQKRRLPPHSAGVASAFGSGWWRLLDGDVLEVPAPAQSPESPRKGHCRSVSDSGGDRTVLSSGLRLLLLSYRQPPCTTLTHVEAWCKIHLNAINTNSFSLAKWSYKLCALISPEMGGKRELVKACGFFFMVTYLDSLAWSLKPNLLSFGLEWGVFYYNFSW